MHYHRLIPLAAALVATSASMPAAEPAGKEILTGEAAFGDYRTERPGVFHKITPADLPKPFATESAGNGPRVVSRPNGAMPRVPAGFKVDLYATGLDMPRLIRAAPNGDFFMAESDKGEILIFRGIGKDGKPLSTSVFATGLRQNFGIAFYPPGSNPQYVYAG